VLASNIDAFFENAKRRSGDLPEEERAALVQRLEEARAMFGGTDAIQHFRAWRSPEERTGDR